jgi:hypothetical protein
MVDLTVDRLHLRYIGDAARFDDQIRRVAVTALEHALRQLSLPPDVHICIRRLTVPVTLARDTLTAAGSWADQVARALSQVTADDDVIVYRHTLDVLVDMLTSAGRGDHRRDWAWRATGVLPPGPVRPSSLATALLRHPPLVCAAITVAASAGPIPLHADGWLTVAQAVAGLDTADPVVTAPRRLPGSATFDHPLAHRLPAAELAGRPREHRAVVARLLLLCAEPALSRSGPAITAVVNRLMTAGSRDCRPAAPRPVPASPAPAPTATAGTPRTDAGLTDIPAGIPANALAAPARSPAGTAPDDAASVDAASVDAAQTGSPTGRLSEEPSVTTLAGSPAISRTGEVAGPSAMSHRPGDISPVPSPAEAPASPTTTPVGGVFFLVRALDHLFSPSPQNPAPRPAPRDDGSVAGARVVGLGGQHTGAVVGWVAASLAGVGTGDPAVQLLVEGVNGPQAAAEPGPAEALAIAALAAEVADELRRMLRLEPGDDLGWLWRRTAVIDARPGWIEITYSLDDVDTRIRAAGLDLDPGFVWWLGAVVRFRYA